MNSDEVLEAHRSRFHECDHSGQGCDLVLYASILQKEKSRLRSALEGRVIRCLACDTPHVHFCRHVWEPDKCPKYRCNPACKEVQDALAMP